MPPTGNSNPGHQALRGGIYGKIMTLTDPPGNQINFRRLPGQAHDLRTSAAPINGLTCGLLCADRAFGANWLREALAAGSARASRPYSIVSFPLESTITSANCDTDRDLPPKAPGIVGDHHALLQNRHKLQGVRSPYRNRNPTDINIARP